MDNEYRIDYSEIMKTLRNAEVVLFRFVTVPHAAARGLPLERRRWAVGEGRAARKGRRRPLQEPEDRCGRASACRRRSAPSGGRATLSGSSMTASGTPSRSVSSTPAIRPSPRSRRSCSRSSAAWSATSTPTPSAARATVRSGPPALPLEHLPRHGSTVKREQFIELIRKALRDVPSPFKERLPEVDIVVKRRPSAARPARRWTRAPTNRCTASTAASR